MPDYDAVAIRKARKKGEGRNAERIMEEGRITRGIKYLDEKEEEK